MQKRIQEKAPKVDYRLLYKKQILDYLESLKDTEQTIWQMDESMKRLFRIGEQVIPVCLAKLRENDEEIAPIVCYALEFANDYSVVEPLMDILIMPNVSDRIKARILAVLTHYGIDASELPLEIIMEDFDKMASDSMAEMLEDIESDPFLIPYILDDLDEFSLEMKLAYIKDLGAQKDERAIPLLEIMALVDDYPVAYEAIKALGQIKSGKALYVLYKLATKSAEEDIQRIAHRESQRLKFNGISMEFFEPWENLQKPAKVFISSIDGIGSRVLWIAWKNPFKSRKLSFMNLLISADMGVRDCWGVSNITTREFNSSVKDFSRTTVVTKCDLDYAITLLGDALFFNKTKDYPIPYQFYFWKHLLEQNCHINCEPYYPQFAGYDLESIEKDQECFKSTFDLFNHSFFNDWFIAHPRVYDYAEGNKSKKGYLIKKMTYQKAEKLFARFTEELIEPNADKVKRMLELSADFLDKAGQTEIAETALCAFLHMDIKPLYHHPFIQRMIIESIKVALNNMKNGFDMRFNPGDFE
ncbi:HEAT repeat domain-containing protein [Tepidanaerobacter acetatoxydans]|uniref:HEAT repeat domain-containing protein n=1 Tax=Tepidanaerobacter acetatoxydans TaxID=499229 RepID=UPI001BD573C1|nr:HEAT repeat domain-containing protein [Tepidanaerobacter acetatoxydans]